MIEITKEVAYAMNNFYRSSKAKKVEIKNELGEVVDKMLREVPYSGQSIDGEGFMIEDFPDLNCDVEHCVLTKMEQQDTEIAGVYDSYVSKTEGLFAQYESQFNERYSSFESTLDNWDKELLSAYTDFMAKIKLFQSDAENEFNTWFELSLIHI